MDRQFPRRKMLQASTAGLLSLTGCSTSQIRAQQAQQGSQVSGQVNDPFNNPVPDADIVVYDNAQTAEEPLASTTTNSEGRFTFDSFEQADDQYLLVKDSETGLFLANPNVSSLPANDSIELTPHRQLLFGPELAEANFGVDTPELMEITVWRQFLGPVGGDTARDQILNIELAGNFDPNGSREVGVVPAPSFAITLPENGVVVDYKGDQGVADTGSTMYLIQDDATEDRRLRLADWHPALTGGPSFVTATSAYQEITENIIEEETAEAEVVTKIAEALPGLSEVIGIGKEIVGISDSEISSRTIVGEEIESRPSRNEVDTVAGSLQFGITSCVFSIPIRFTEPEQKLFIFESDWSAHPFNTDVDRLRFQKQISLGARLNVPSASPSDSSPTDSESDPQDGAIQHSNSGAARTKTENQHASLINLEVENVRFGGENSHSLRIQSGQGDSLTLTMDQDNEQEFSGSVVLKIYDGDGSIAENPQIDPGNNSGIPVEITGDTSIFRPRPIFNSYSVELVDDTEVIDSTENRVYGIGYPGTLEQDSTSGEIEVSFPLDREVEESWPVIFTVVDWPYDGAGNRHVWKEFSREDGQLVTTFNADELPPIPEDGFRDYDVEFYVDNDQDIESVPPNLWAHGYLETDQPDSSQESNPDNFIHDFEDQSLARYVGVYNDKSDWSIDSEIDGYSAYVSIPSGTSFIKLDPEQYLWSGNRAAQIEFKADTTNWKRNAFLWLGSGNDAYIVGVRIQGDSIVVNRDSGQNGDWERIQSMDKSITDSEVHSMTAYLRDSSISVHLDQEKVLDVNINNSLREGSIGFGVLGDISTATWFDNFAVNDLE